MYVCLVQTQCSIHFCMVQIQIIQEHLWLRPSRATSTAGPGWSKRRGRCGDESRCHEAPDLRDQWDQWFMVIHPNIGIIPDIYGIWNVYDPIGDKHGIYNNIGYPSQYYMGKVTWVYNPIGYKMLSTYTVYDNITNGIDDIRLVSYWYIRYYLVFW